MKTSRLEKMLRDDQKINLGNLFDYLQGIAEELTSIIRWEAREKIAGQSVRENDLQHTFKMIFLTVMYATMENEHRTYRNKLDIGMLATMALVHDIGEIIEGDMAHFIKAKSRNESHLRELTAFKRIIAPLPNEAQEYFLQAFQNAINQAPKSKKEARFFNAIENLGHLKRGLHECQQGNLHFAPKCLNWHITALQNYSKEFPSLIALYEPYIDKANAYLEKFEQEKEKYIEEFILRGGQRKNFPF